MSDQREPLTPVDADRVARLLASLGFHHFEIHSVESTESTNADAAALLRHGAKAGTVVVSATQTQGRGRLDREWVDQGNDSLSFSAIIHPPGVVPVENYGWISLLAGLAVVNVLRKHGVDASTKWPNDVIIDGPSEDGSSSFRKLGGILSEGQDDYVIVGIGLNLTSEKADLPTSSATSAAIEGGRELDREVILVDVLVELATLIDGWSDAYGDAEGAGLLAQYVESNATVGKDVEVVHATGADSGNVVGRALGIDEYGQLIVESSGGNNTLVSAGDVQHLR